MPTKLDPIEFRSPIATVDFSELVKQKNLPLILDPVWQRRFQAWQDFINDAAAAGLLEASSAVSTRETDESSGAGLSSPGRGGSSGAVELVAEDAVLRLIAAARPQSESAEDSVLQLASSIRTIREELLSEMMALVPAARPLSTPFFPIVDTIANQGIYPAAQFYPGRFIASDTLNEYYSSGSAWVALGPYSSAWTAFVPTYSTDAGDAAASFTVTPTTTLGRYKVIGKMAWVELIFQAQLKALISPSQVFATLPFTPGSSPRDTAMVANNSTYEGGFVLIGISPDRFDFRRNGLAAWSAAALVDCACMKSFEAA